METVRGGGGRGRTFSSSAIIEAAACAASARCFSWATSVRRIVRICLNWEAVILLLGVSSLNLSRGGRRAIR